MEKPLPEVLALVIADLVYHDDVSQKLSLLGVRSRFFGSSFPVQLAQLSAYAVIVEGRGSMTFEICLTDADDERPSVYENDVKVDFLDPLTEAELIFDMRELTFPEPGDYRLQLRVEGQFLCERRLLLVPTGD
jgi:hypothetical protein